MGKVDELMKSSGGSIMESASHRSAPVAMPTAASRPLASGPLAGAARSKVGFEIPVDRIERDPSQPREEFDPIELQHLADSMKAHGQLQPIVVRPDQGRGVYVIIAGERRWRAAGIAGFSTVSCTVHDKALTPGELLTLQMIENLVRDDLKPVEQAKAFRTLMDSNGWSGNELAKQLNIAQSGVVAALRLLDVAPTIQASIDRGEIKASTGVILAKIEDPEQQAEVAARVVAEGLSREETAEVVRQVAPKAPKSAGKGRGAGVKAKAKPKGPVLLTEAKHKAANDIRIIGTRRKGFDLAAWLEALEDAASSVRAKLEAEQGGEPSHASGDAREAA